MSKVWNLIDSSNLVNGASWADAQGSIRAQVFGKMVELAEGRIDQYRSDLFHDALWIREMVTGPMRFDWIARESGTFIGETCLHIKDEQWPDSARYRFEIIEDEDYTSKWVLNVYQAEDDVIKDTGDWREKIPGTGINYYGDPVVDNDSDGTFTEDDRGNWHPVASESVSNETVNPINELIDALFAKPMGFRPHSELPLEECDSATKAAGCIYHPAPMASNFPTLRNETTRKENKMESIIRDLREKYEEASNSKDQLEEFQSNINDAVDELDTYMSDLDSLIDSLDSLPEISVYVELETVSFDS